MDATSQSHFAWPDGCRSAVSLTFDDGMQSQRMRAVPILNQYSLHATFYVNPRDNFEETLSAWQEAVAAGHELGNHTVRHPCSKNFSFISASDRIALEDMTLADMEAEILLAKQRLQQVFPERSDVSFAYPCYQPFVGCGEGRASYVPLVAKHCVAGRGRGERANDPLRCDLAYVWSYPCERMGGAEMVGLVEESIAEGRWTVLTFHGVHEENLSVSDSDFELVCRHLAANQGRIWTETVAQVAKHIRAERAALAV